ncbi:hypothetical protein HN51_030906 [Arachis hypogaea]|nr:myosin-1-like isoform [Arachis hypogaea]
MYIHYYKRNASSLHLPLFLIQINISPIFSASGKEKAIIFANPTSLFLQSSNLLPLSCQFNQKPNLGHSPFSHQTTGNKSLETMSIPELIQILRVKRQKEDYDRVEKALIAREEKLKTKVGQLEEKFQIQSLARIDAEKVQGLYETLFKEVKESGLDKETIKNLRKKNKEVECENLKLLELKNKCEVDGNAVDELRKKVAELEAEKKNNLNS